MDERITGVTEISWTFVTIMGHFSQCCWDFWLQKCQVGQWDSCPIKKKFEKKIFFSKKNLSFHNTLSKSLAESDIQKEPFKKKFSIECKPLTKIIDNTKFNERKIDFLNIDAEGYDYQVLLGLDIKKYCPKAICIEISPLVDKKNENYKDTKIYKYLLQNNYKLTWKGSNSFIFLFQPEQQLV